MSATKPNEALARVLRLVEGETTVAIIADGLDAVVDGRGYNAEHHAATQHAIQEKIAAALKLARGGS